MTKFDDYLCERPKYMSGVCTSGHVSRRVLRCRSCQGCVSFKNLIRKLQIYKRIEMAGIQDEKVVMWTLGTNWDDTEENVIKLREVWNKFNIYMHNTQDNFKMYMRVYEKGSQGGKLHVHFISPEYSLDHKQALKQWSRLTGHHGPNVRFDRSPKADHHIYKYKRDKNGQFYKTDEIAVRKGERLPASFAFKYLAKYLSKEYFVKYGLYWGNDLKYKYKPIIDDRVCDLSGELVGSVLYSNGNGGFKSTRIFKAFMDVPGMKWVKDQYYEVLDKKWIDNDIRCSTGNCNSSLIIKYGELLDYQELVSVLKNIPNIVHQEDEKRTMSKFDHNLVQYLKWKKDRNVPVYKLNSFEWISEAFDTSNNSNAKNEL